MTTPSYTPPDDATLRRILKSARTIAMVGASLNPVRPSYFVARYLSLRGFRVIPINPGHAGKVLFGETVRAGLADCPEDTDMLDIFRRSEHVAPIVAEAIGKLPRLRTIWLQIGVESAEAFDMVPPLGLDFVQNRCPKIEYQRLLGELRMAGFNPGVISSRL